MTRISFIICIFVQIFPVVYSETMQRVKNNRPNMIIYFKASL